MQSIATSFSNNHDKKKLQLKQENGNVIEEYYISFVKGACEETMKASTNPQPSTSSGPIQYPDHTYCLEPSLLIKPHLEITMKFIGEQRGIRETFATSNLEAVAEKSTLDLSSQISLCFCLCLHFLKLTLLNSQDSVKSYLQLTYLMRKESALRTLF